MERVGRSAGSARPRSAKPIALMDEGCTILITGAAGNLGSLLARHLAPSGHALRLMVHRRPLSEDLMSAPNVRPVRADLRDPSTLRPALDGLDVVVRFAGVLFAPRPEHFLPETNTLWFSNLVTAALEANVRKVILISFPHVEGPTSREQPAAGRLDRTPISVHARTRLEEERLLFERTRGTRTTPVVLRLGMVYGRGILMIEAALWLATSSGSGASPIGATRAGRARSSFPSSSIRHSPRAFRRCAEERCPPRKLNPPRTQLRFRLCARWPSRRRAIDPSSSPRGAG